MGAWFGGGGAEADSDPPAPPNQPLVPVSRGVAGAIDTEVLAPLGFTRGIFRTEFHKDTGDRLLPSARLRHGGEE